MEHYILTSHGSLAYGMKTAVEMICGKVEQLESYDLNHYDSPDDIYNILEEMISKNNQDSYIIFTDLLGGSVQNKLICLGKYENTVIITGMHLGLVLSMITEKPSVPLQQFADEAIQATLPMIVAYAKEKIELYIGKGVDCEI